MALEGFVVLFGVLAALLVDRVREDVVQHRAARAAVDRLFEEVAQNLGEMRGLQHVASERLDSLRALRDAPPDLGLSDLIGRFYGFRTPDLSEAAWERLSTSQLADSVDPELLSAAFYLYEWNHQFDRLDDQINRLVYSEIYYLPERRPTAIDVSERIMEQQLSWAAQAIPMFEAFLARRGT